MAENGASSATASRGNSSRGSDARKVSDLDQKGRQLTAALGEIVAVLMRDPRFRHMTLSEIEAAVVPAIASNQFMLMRGSVRARTEGNTDTVGEFTIPMGLAIWATVSDEVSAKLDLQAKDGAGFRLAASEWKGGANMWLLLLAGPDKALPSLVARLKADVWGANEVRMGAWARLPGAVGERT